MFRCWWVERLFGPVPLQCFKSCFLTDLPSRCSSSYLRCAIESTAIFIQVSVAFFTHIQVNFVYLAAVFFGVCRLKIVLFYDELILWSINNVLIKIFDWKLLLSDISLVMPMLLMAICMAYLFFHAFIFILCVCVLQDASCKQHLIR